MNTTTDFRYPGSRPFNDTFFDRRLFFGRNHEKASLLHMVLAENLVVLFAKSGMGKTSLLNAGIMQPLRQREYIPFMIRLNIPDIDPLQAVYKGIKDALDRNRIEYTPGEENTLWQYFKTVEFWSSEDTLLTPVLILDQFEELFTLHSPEKRKAFITQLADLVKDRVPKDLRKSLKPGERLPYGEMRSKVKIIISIREDFLGQLEELAHEIPDILHNRFRLVALSREQAKKAIVEPARLEDEQIVTASFQYAPETVEAMLDFFCERRERKTKVRTDEVEPFQLQLLCQHIESKVREKVDKKGAADIIIQKDDLGGEAGMRRVLKDFYVNQINRLDSPWKKRRVRSLCEKHLISDTDRRLSLEEEKIERKYKVSRKLLKALVDSRLLRAEPRVGSVYYELSHDTLVEPIRKSQSERKTGKAKVFAIIAIPLVIIITLFLLELKQIYEINEIYREAGGLKDREKFTEAIEKYKKILEIDKSFLSAYLELGEIYYRIERLDESARKYRDAIQIAPKLSQAYRRIGDIAKSQKKFKEAIENYKKALEYGDSTRETYSGLVISYMKLGEYTEAIHKYDDAIEVKPEYADIYMDLVIELRKEGMRENIEEVYRKALEIFENELNSDKSNENTYKQVTLLNIRLAGLYSEQKNYVEKDKKLEDLIKFYKQGIKDSTEYASIYTSLIRELKKQRMRYHVDKIYQIALEVESKGPSYYLDLGYTLEREKKYKMAIDSYKKAVQINPKLSEAYEALGKLYGKLKKFDQAIEVYGRAVKVSPKNAYIYTYLDRALRKEKKEDEVEKVYQIASDAYEEALKTGDKSGRTFRNLASLYIKLGEIDQAIEVYVRAVKVSPKNAYIYTDLVSALRKEKKEDEVEKVYRIASDAYEEALKKGGKSGRTFRNLASLYIKLGEIDQAIEVYVRAVKVSPKNAYIYTYLDRALRKEKKEDEVEKVYQIASDAYEEALKTGDKSGRTFSNLARLYIKLGEIDQAIEVYVRAVKVSPKNAYIYTYLDRALRKEKKEDEVEKVYQIASDAYEEALKTGDKSGRTFSNLARLYIKLGEIDQAIEVYVRAVEVSPKNAYIYTSLIRTLKNEGMEDQVDRIFEIASKAGSKDPSYYLNFGAALYWIEEYDDAIQNFKKAVQLNPEDAKAYSYLGRAFNRLTNYPEAKENFKKAMEFSPENIVYQKNFAEANLRTGDFEKAFEWAHQVLKTPKISTRDRLPMGFISISSLLFQGERPEAFAELKKFIADLNSLPKGYRVSGWRYEVSKKIIKNSTQLEKTDKTLLLKLIDILEAFKTKTNQKQKLEAFERYLSEMSEQ